MEKELILSITKKDFEISFYNGTGNGGQNRNKVSACVHMKHIESGITSSAQNSRDQRVNLQEAFKKIINSPEFKLWHRMKIAAICSKEKKKFEMNDADLLVEEYKDGEWKELKENDTK